MNKLISESEGMRDEWHKLKVTWSTRHWHMNIVYQHISILVKN